MRVLVVSPTPTHPVTAGNRARIRSYCEYLQKSGVQVAFLYYGMEGLSSDTAALHSAAWNWYFECPFDPTLYPVDGVLSDIDSLVSPQLVATFKNACDLIAPDAVICNYVWLSAVFEHGPANLRKIIDTHDRFAARHDLLVLSGAPKSWLSTDVVQEMRALSRADRVWGITDRDAAYFARFVGERAVVVGHFQHQTGSLPGEGTAVPRLLRIGFIGSDNVTNEGAVRVILSAAPDMAAQQVSILIAGGVTRRFGHVKSGSANVSMVEYFADIGSFYETVDLVVAPIFFGTGLKIKTIEAMTFGKPIVGGAEAFAGIPTQCKFHLCRDGTEFREALSEVVANREAFRALADATHAAFENYRRQVIAELEREVAYVSGIPAGIQGGQSEYAFVAQEPESADLEGESIERQLDVISRFPQSGLGYVAFAARLAKAQELEIAGVALSAGLAVDPGCASTYLFAALLDLARGDYPQAEFNYRLYHLLGKEGVADPGSALLQGCFVLPLVAKDPSVGDARLAKVILKAAQKAGQLSAEIGASMSFDRVEDAPQGLLSDAILKRVKPNSVSRAQKVYPFFGTASGEGSASLVAVYSRSETSSASRIQISIPAVDGISVSDVRVDDAIVNHAIRRYDGRLEVTIAATHCDAAGKAPPHYGRVTITLNSPTAILEATKIHLRDQFSLSSEEPSERAGTELPDAVPHVPFIDIHMIDAIAGEGWYKAESGGLRWMSAKGVIYVDCQVRAKTRLLVVCEGTASASGQKFSHLDVQLGGAAATGLVGFSDFGEWRYVGIIDVEADERPGSIKIDAPFPCAIAGPDDRRLISVQVRRFVISEIVTPQRQEGPEQRSLWGMLVAGAKGLNLRYTRADGYRLAFSKSFEVTLPSMEMEDANRLTLNLRRGESDESPKVAVALNGEARQFSLAYDVLARGWLLDLDLPWQFKRVSDNHLRVDVEGAFDIVILGISANSNRNSLHQDISVGSITGKGLFATETIGPGIEARWLAPRSEIELDVPDWTRAVEIEGIFERGYVKGGEVELLLSGTPVIPDGSTVREGFWSMRFTLPPDANLPDSPRLTLGINVPARPLMGTDRMVSIMVSKIRCHRAGVAP